MLTVGTLRRILDSPWQLTPKDQRIIFVRLLVISKQLCVFQRKTFYLKILFIILQELDRIQSWMTSRESHQYCNTFSLVMICDGTDDGKLFDYQGETFSSITDLTNKFIRVQSLKKKPKLIIIKRCSGNYTGPPSNFFATVLQIIFCHPLYPNWIELYISKL